MSGGPQLTNASGASAYNFESDFTVFVDYICLDPAEENNCIIGKGNITTPFPFMVLGQYATNRFSILRTGSTGTAVNAVISGVGTARDVTRIAMGKRGGDLFLHAYNKAANYYNTVTDTTTGSHANIAPLTLGNRDNGYFQSKNIYKSVLIYNRALSVAELESLCDNPLQIYQPRTVWIPVAASGGGSVISDANAGTFTITGYTATSVYTALGRYSSSADTGEFTIIGYSATAARTYSSSADAGTFAVTGASATSGRGLSSVASPSNYTITGSNATAYLTYISSALSGAYTISGANAISIIGGRATILPPSLFATTVKMQSRDNVLRITTSESVSRIKL